MQNKLWPSWHQWLLGRSANLRLLLSGTTIVMGFRLLRAMAGFVFGLLLARGLGSEQTGLFYISLTYLSALTVLGLLGTDKSLLRFVAKAMPGEIKKANGIFRLGLMWSIPTALTMSLLFSTTSDWLALELIGQPALIETFYWLPLLILPMVLIGQFEEVFKASGHLAWSSFTNHACVLLLACMLLLLFWLFHIHFSLSLIWKAYASGIILTLVLAALVWVRHYGVVSESVSKESKRSFRGMTVTMFGVSLVNLLMGYSDNLVLSLYAEPEQIGQYNIALRIAALVSFILVAVNAVTAPRYARFHAAGDYLAMKNLVTTASRYMSLVGLLVTLLMLLGANGWLHLFGEEFVGAKTELQILAVGQFINVVCGSVGYLLMMTGFEKDYRNLILVGAIANLVMNLTLVPTLGITGAALATSLTLLLINLVGAYLVYQRLGIITFPKLPKRWGIR